MCSLQTYSMGAVKYAALS